MERFVISRDPNVVAAADRLFDKIRDRIVESLPDCRVEHIGGTSVPGVVTKGDLDVQVLIAAERFEAARDVIGAMWPPYSGGFESAQSQSFKDDDLDPPLGVHLIVAGCDDDFQWRCRDVLRARPDLVERLNAIKRRHDGGSMDAYRDEKHGFFEALELEPDYPRL